MNDNPCISCLILPICKASVLACCNTREAHIKVLNISLEKCSLLETYITDERSIDENGYVFLYDTNKVTSLIKFYREEHI